MTVMRRSKCDMYYVAQDGESATMCIDAWANESSKSTGFTTYGGELLIHSSFGSFCHTWTNCAVPFKEFLARIGFHSFASKCLGADAVEFDGNASVASFKEQLLDLRAAGVLSKERARELWDYLDEDMAHNEFVFHKVLDEICDEADGFDEPTSHIVKKPNRQALQFWKQLWPLLKSMLEQELTTNVIAAKAA